MKTFSSKMWTCLPLCALGAMLSATSLPAFQAPDKPDKDTSSPNTKSEAAGDRELTAKVRKAIMDDHNLSMSAHNVKIATHDGKVTLKGKVRTEEERNAVVAKAKEVAGPNNVTDDLTVASGGTSADRSKQ